uniref:Uncharacterized protein n=1 Tax=Brassica oleracea var. oleracea TaxID=109376 RepID=A0A0D3ATV6_BRAOL
MIRPRQRRGRGGTGSQSRDSSLIKDSYHTSPSPFPASAPLAPAAALAPAPAAAPAPAPPGPLGVMSVAELVRQPGRDHLPYLTPFNRSGNGISAWINRMMYSALDKGHPTFTDFPIDKQHLWFCQFSEMNPRKFPTNVSSEYTEGHIPRNIPTGTFLGNFRGLRSSEFPDENSEEHFVGTSEDWTIGKSIEISRGSSPSVYSEDLSDELVVLGVSSEIHFLRIPS